MQKLHRFLRYTDRPVNVFFLLFAVILPESYEKTRRKDWVTEKNTKKKNDLSFLVKHVKVFLSNFSHFLPLFNYLMIWKYLQHNLHTHTHTHYIYIYIYINIYIYIFNKNTIKYHYFGKSICRQSRAFLD